MVQVGPQWFHWILKWSQTVPESPRRPIKFQKNSQVLPFSGIDYLLAPSGDLGVVAFLNFMIISPLSSKSHPVIWVFQMVKVGPQWFHWILKWSQTVPESPRQSFKFQKKFPTFTISEIHYLLAPPGDLGVVAFLNLMIISSLSPKTHPIHM